MTKHLWRDPAKSSQACDELACLEATRSVSTSIRRASLINNGDPSVLADVVGTRPIFVAISPTVNRLYSAEVGPALRSVAGGQHQTYVVPTGEDHKTLSVVESLVDAMSMAGLSRDGVVVGIGGGVLLDIVGLAAGLFRRGIAHIKIGTTLVAQIDAAVGLKCGVNVGEAKNIAGAFNPPELVLTDGNFLSSLAVRDVRCGLAEMVKLAVATDVVLFDELERHGALLLDPVTRDMPAARRLIDRSISGMVAELNANPYETELRRRVDFGHTVSGSYEIASGHTLLHGEAVALDIALFSSLAMLLGRLRRAETERILRLLLDLGIDVWHPIMEDTELLEQGLQRSASHRGRRLHLPVPTRIGDTAFISERNSIPDDLLAEAVSVVRQMADDYRLNAR